jgi:HEAT repeat protein
VLIQEVEMLRLTRSRLRRLPAGLCLALAAAALTSADDARAQRPGGKGGDKPALEWVEDLESPTQGTRTRATIALAKLEPAPPELVARVATLLDHENWSVRAQALMVLGNMGADASSALPTILGALHDENEHVRRSAASALPKVPARTRETRLALVKALGAENRYLRTEAGYALAAVAGAADDVAPELARLAAGDDRQTREAANKALAKLPADAVVPVLIPLLTHEDGSVRQAASGTLGAFGPAARAAVPTLIALLDQYPHHLMAVQTLGRIGAGAKQAIPALLALFDRSDPSRELRIAAARAMSGIGPEAREVLLLFRSELAAQDLSEASGRYRATLATAILAMSGPDDPAIQTYVGRLARAQQSWKPMTRIEAIRALAALGPTAHPALDSLRASLRREREPKIRGLAAEALGGIGGRARPALPDLRKAEAEDEEYVRKRAGAAIAKIEASAEAALPSAGLAKLAPRDEAAERQKEIASDIAALSASGSRQTRAALRLLQRATESLPALHRAVLSADTDDRSRGRLIALLLDLGDPRSVDVLLQTVKAHPQEPGLRVSALRALGELPQTRASFEFATRTLRDTRETPRVRRQALIYFAAQREERGRQWTERFRNDADPDMRAAALYLAASLGDETALEPITALLRGQPRAAIRFGLLLALAELVDPAEFVRRVAPARRRDDEYDSALRIAKLRYDPSKERVVLARRMLESQFPNERRIAVRALLEENALNELTFLLEQWWTVPAHMRATVTAELYRGGYRLVENDRRLEIERRQSSGSGATSFPSGRSG